MKHYLSKILDSIDVIVYVADFRTYEILYINDYTKNLFGDIEGKICWQSLQNRQDGPCSFCTNNRIITSEGTPTGAYHWVFQNTITGQWFDIIDTAIEWKEGHFVRLEVATDITEHKKTEESLIESEKKYHSLVSKIPSVTWTTASDGKTTFISPNVEMIYGYTPDEIYKYGVKLWFERIHPVDVKKVKEAYNKLFKKEGGFDIEYRIKRKDGKWIWLHDRAVTTYEEDGIQFAYGVFDDITNRKRNEDSLKESEERFRQLAENITEVFYISNLQTHQMLYISPAYELIWGQSCESLYSNPYSFVEAIHPDYREHVKHLLDRQLLGEKTEKVYQIIRPDQSMRWIRDRAFPVKGDDGKVVRVIGIAEDITNQKMSEVKIRESEEHYHSLLEISPDAIVETGLDGKILYCNQQASKIHGYDSPAEMIGQDSLQSMFEEDIHIAQNNAALLLDKGYFKNITFRMRKKDDTPVPVEVSASLLRNAEGNPKSFIGYIRDISERKRAEEELHQYEHIVSSSTDMLALLNKRYVYLATNSSYREAFNVTPDQLIGNTVSQVFGEEFFKTIIKPHADRCLSGKEVNYQEWFDFPSKGKRYMNVNYYPYVNDENEIVGIVVNVRDETKRKQTENAQLTLERNLKSLWNLAKLQDKDLKTVADFVLEEISHMSKSKYGFYGFMSKDESIMHVYAWSKEVMKNCSIHDKYISFDIKKAGIWGDAVRKRKNIIINNYSESFQGKKGIPEGHVSLTRILAVPIFSQNRIVAVGAVANKDTDYTNKDVEQLSSFLTSAHLIIARKQVEIERELLHKELKLKNKELEQMLYVTSHDLRSPLVNVEGYGRELEYSLKELMASIDQIDAPPGIKDKVESTVKEDIPESLHYIQTSVSKMNTLLKGILNLSRLGRSELTLKELNMNEMMTDIIDSHRFRLNELKFKTDVSDVPNCKGDNEQINQVFSNLLDNAIKYRDPERPGVIQMSGYKDKNHSVYCIEDNGIGISPEHQNKIFEIFHQLEPNKVKGEGMGLSIAQKIIEKHNGKIWVESELGKGSKFFVSLPS